MTRTILLLLMWLNLSAFNYGKELKSICTSEKIGQLYTSCFEMSVKYIENSCEKERDLMYVAEFSGCEKNEVFCDMLAQAKARLCEEICEYERSGKSYKESKVKIYPFCMVLWIYWLPKMSRSF